MTRCYFRGALDSCRRRDHFHLLRCPSPNDCFGWRRRNLRYATDKFIVALCAIPDRTPSGADRRHCGGQPAFGRRL